MNNQESIFQFILGIKGQSKLYSNHQAILEKAETEGYLHCIHLTLNNIFEREMQFMLGSSLIRLIGIQ